MGILDRMASLLGRGNAEGDTSSDFAALSDPDKRKALETWTESQNWPPILAVLENSDMPRQWREIALLTLCQSDRTTHATELALEHRDPYVRRLALFHVHDPTVLAAVLDTDSMDSVRLVAAQQAEELGYEALAKTFYDWTTDIIDRAIREDDRHLLRAVASTATFPTRFRKRALRNPKDQDFLCTVACSGLTPPTDAWEQAQYSDFEFRSVMGESTRIWILSCREVAIELLDDHDLLRRLAAGDSERSIRYAAAERLGDAELLDAIRRDKERYLRDVARRTILSLPILDPVIVMQDSEQSPYVPLSIEEVLNLMERRGTWSERVPTTIGHASLRDNIDADVQIMWKWLEFHRDSRVLVDIDGDAWSVVIRRVSELAFVLDHPAFMTDAEVQ